VAGVGERKAVVQIVTARLNAAIIHARRGLVIPIMLASGRGASPLSRRPLAGR
jgi:hypothetical protein